MKLSSIALTKAQKEILALNITGNFIVLGVAGSGKSITALFRSIHLSNTSPDAKVLLIAFNQALKKHLTHLLEQYIADQGEGVCDRERITIATYHEFAMDYLGESVKVISTHWQNKYMAEAVDAVVATTSATFDVERLHAIIKQEIAIIEDFGLMMAGTYAKKASHHVTPEEATLIYSIYQKYIQIRKANAYDCDLSDIGSYVFSQYRNKPTGYTHIIVDEGQDLSPMMIKSLVNAKSFNGSFTYFGDVSQQIYRDLASWSECYIPQNTPIITLEQNYRNTPEIINFAKDIIKSTNWQPNEYTLDFKVNVANGMKPILKKCNSHEDETNWVVGNIKHTKNGAATNVVVLRTTKEVTAFVKVLAEQGIDAIRIDRKSEEMNFGRFDVVYVTTYHTAKGLEFDTVYIPYCNAPEVGDTTQTKDVFLQLKLLYVVVTRSRGGLILSYHTEPSSILPLDSQNLQKIE